MQSIAVPHSASMVHGVQDRSVQLLEDGITEEDVSLLEALPTEDDGGADALDEECAAEDDDIPNDDDKTLEDDGPLDDAGPLEEDGPCDVEDPSVEDEDGPVDDEEVTWLLDSPLRDEDEREADVADEEGVGPLEVPEATHAPSLVHVKPAGQSLLSWHASTHTPRQTRPSAHSLSDAHWKSPPTPGITSGQPQSNRHIDTTRGADRDTARA